MNFIRQSGFLTFLTIPNLQKESGSFRARYTKILKAAIITQFVSIVVLLILTSCSSLVLRSTKPVQMGLNAASAPEVNEITSSQNGEVDLRLGYSERGVNCQFFSELVTLVLQKEENLNISLTVFETENELFDALSEQKIDLTLCFIDPLDRIQLTKPERLGHIRQIGSYYWEDEHKKLQIWAHTYAKTKLRNEMPCVYRFLEELRLTENSLNEGNALTWYQNHTNEVRNGLKCQP